tara:strand:- start:494 stop:919 length:426 start_codon:yes stop_codon:yes gene_type:complete
MAWMQKQFTLSPKSRGFHLVTNEIGHQIPELASFRVGLAHIFICHTSASLTINENAAPDVRHDFEQHMNIMVPENQPYYRHTDEGVDDMPAHIKASMMDNSLSIPITNGCLNMGTWQGIYLCEHRNHASGRKIIVTLQGEA